MTQSGPGAGAVEELLVTGELEVLGRLVDASNATLLARVRGSAGELQCIYKPRAGERPLWDFPAGDLAEREVATYELSRALGWDLVPLTRIRPEGPYGAGMVQVWVETADETDLVDVVAPNEVPAGWRQVLEARDGDDNPVVLVHADDPSLQRLAVLDAIANNGDRKGGHVLVSETGTTFGIDHGVSWHVEDKLRTVLWGWAASPIPDDIMADISALETNWMTFAGVLEPLLNDAEVAAARQRLQLLLETAAFPLPSPDWPAIPWPVF